MEHKKVFRDNKLGKTFLLLAWVNAGIAVVVKDPKSGTKMNVKGRRLNVSVLTGRVNR